MGEVSGVGEAFHGVDYESSIAPAFQSLLILESRRYSPLAKYKGDKSLFCPVYV